MSKQIKLPDGTETTVPVRKNYKFCIALKLGGIWISSWAESEQAKQATIAMWQSKIQNLDYKVISL